MTVTELMVELQRLADAGEGGRRVTVVDDSEVPARGFVTGVWLEDGHHVVIAAWED